MKMKKLLSNFLESEQFFDDFQAKFREIWTYVRTGSWIAHFGVSWLSPLFQSEP